MCTSDPVIYRFGEKIHIGNADGIREALGAAFESSGITAIFLDLGNVQMCDSYGLRLLLGFQRRAQETGKRLTLCRPAPLIREILATVNLTRVFEIRDDLPQAGAERNLPAP